MVMAVPVGLLCYTFRGPSIYDYSRLVHPGMTLDEVKAVCGRPAAVTDFRDGWKAVDWEANDGWLCVYFEDGKSRHNCTFPTNGLDQAWRRIRRTIGF